MVPTFVGLTSHRLLFLPLLSHRESLDVPGEGFPVMEAGAILLYLAKFYDDDDEFGFINELERNVCLQWMFFQTGGVGPMQGQLNHFNVYAEQKIPYAIKRYKDETLRLYGVIEGRLSGKFFRVGQAIEDLLVFIRSHPSPPPPPLHTLLVASILYPPLQAPSLALLNVLTSPVRVKASILGRISTWSPGSPDTTTLASPMKIWHNSSRIQFGGLKGSPGGPQLSVRFRVMRSRRRRSRLATRTYLTSER